MVITMLTPMSIGYIVADRRRQIPRSSGSPGRPSARARSSASWLGEEAA